MFASLANALVHAQTKPTASRLLDVQVGGEFHIENTDYNSAQSRGFGLYSTLDWSKHLGAEVSLHQVSDPAPSRKLREQTIEIGPRYVFRFGPWNPYGKLLVGRGSFQFPPDPRYPENGPVATLGYNFLSGGFGVDYHLCPSLHVRADYEIQEWLGFPPSGRNPKTITFGFAYHFH